MRHLILATITATAFAAANSYAAEEKKPAEPAKAEAAKPAAPSVSRDIALAPAGEYVLEKNHASITFKANHMGFADYVMRFNDFDATITLDPKAPEKSSVTATITPASLDSNNPKMTEHSSGKDFFNVALFPTITFASTKIEKTGDTTGKIHGDLTMLGVKKPVVLDATFIGGGNHMMMQKYDIGFKATTIIKRSDFGMNYGTPMVSDAIPVEINAEFIQNLPDKNTPAAEKK